MNNNCFLATLNKGIAASFSEKEVCSVRCASTIPAAACQSEAGKSERKKIKFSGLSPLENFEEN
jgi:hypothetical protein